MEPQTPALPPLVEEGDRTVRRVRSENDLADESGEGPSYRRPGKHGHGPRRSEGQRAANTSGSPSTSVLPATAPASPSLASPMPTQSIQVPSRVFIRDSIANLDIAETFNPDELPDLDRATVRPHRTRSVPPGLWGKILVFIGQVGPDARVRSKFMSFLWSACFGLVQFVVITTLLAYSSRHESPTIPGESEWKACERPLGAWNTIWIIRNFFACLYAYWIWKVELKASQQRASVINALNEAQASRARRQSRNSRRNNRDPLSPVSTHSDFLTDNERQARLPPPTPPMLLARLGNLTDALGIVWFLTAHILVYTTVKTCRFAAPHLWWLSFSIICILYFMILEVFLVGLVVFIFWPVFYLTWNIFLLCIGRHPMQRTPLKHQIGKLSKATVDQIPLVLYIPSPSDESATEKDEKEYDGDSPSMPNTYPPVPSDRPPRKRRFAFFRRSKKSKSKSHEGHVGEGDGEPRSWEDNWVAGEYPFVRLEGNRAACAICLMDFEEPRRRAGDGAPRPVPSTDAAAGTEVQEVRVEEITSEDAQRLRLEDAGEGPQPLRLLGCGHVFHKTCIDPWLIDVSGRCPVCQRGVEVAKEKNK